MSREIYKYEFESTVEIAEVESSLLLSLLAAECVHGESQARLDARHFFDVEQRCCVIDAGSDVGRDLNRLFIGFLHREFGEEAFSVRKVDHIENPVVAEAAA